MAEASRPSQFSLGSLRETASQLPHRKVLYWVAPWFTVSQLVAKLLSATIATIAASLTLSWTSEGVTAHDLDTDTFQFRGRVLTFVVVGFLTMVCAVAMVIIGLTGVKVHAKVLTCVAGLVLLLWFLSAPVMSATITELADSKWARWRGVDVTQLEVAVGLGFLCLIVSIVDILLAFVQLSQVNTHTTGQFSMEMEASRSTIQAVKSGLSLPLSVTGTLRQRSSRATPYLSHTHSSSRDPVTMATEQDTLVASGDLPDLEDDSTWEAISHDITPLHTSS